MLSLAVSTPVSVSKTISVKFSCSIPTEEKRMEVTLLPLSRSSSIKGAKRRRLLLEPKPWKTRMWWERLRLAATARRRERRRSIAPVSQQQLVLD